MCESGAMVFTVTLKHKTKNATRVVKLREGDLVFSKEGAASFALSMENEKSDDWVLKTVTQSYDANWMD